MPDPVVPPAKGTEPDPMAGFRALLKEATASGASLSDRETKLLRENYRAREKLRIANEALAKAETEGTKVPKDAVVLTGEDATTYGEFKKLNLKVKDITDRLAERDTLATERAQRDTDVMLDGVAEEMGLNPRAFKRLVKAEGLTVTVKTTKVRDEESGKMVEEQVPVVKRAGAKDTDEAEELAAVLERDFADDLDSLVASGEPGDERTTPRSVTRRSAEIPEDEAPGTRFPRTRTVAPTRQTVSRKAQEEAVTAKAASGRYAL